MNKELTEEIRKAVRQFAFDIVMSEFGGDDTDPDDQDYATEAVDAWMEHWRTTGAVRVAAAVRGHLTCNTVTDQPNEVLAELGEDYPDWEWIAKTLLRRRGTVTDQMVERALIAEYDASGDSWEDEQLYGSPGFIANEKATMRAALEAALRVEDET